MHIIVLTSYISLLLHCQVAVPDLTAACTDADVLVFVTPHQFVEKACQTILPHLKKDAVAVSLIKVCGTLGNSLCSMVQLQLLLLLLLLLLLALR